MTPLFIATQKGYTEVVAALLATPGIVIPPPPPITELENIEIEQDGKDVDLLLHEASGDVFTPSILLIQSVSWKTGR